MYVSVLYFCRRRNTVVDAGVVFCISVTQFLREDVAGRLCMSCAPCVVRIARSLCTSGARPRSVCIPVWHKSSLCGGVVDICNHIILLQNTQYCILRMRWLLHQRYAVSSRRCRGSLVHELRTVRRTYRTFPLHELRKLFFRECPRVAQVVPVWRRC